MLSSQLQLSACQATDRRVIGAPMTTTVRLCRFAMTVHTKRPSMHVKAVCYTTWFARSPFGLLLFLKNVRSP